MAQDLAVQGESGSGFLKQLRAPLIGAGVLLAVDAAVYGSFLFSIFAAPVWFLIAGARALIRRGDWRVSVVRVAIPAVTLVIVLGNAWVQSRIARANAERIIEAATRYKAANGAYPSTLSALVPKFLDTVPRAKYALIGDFMYLKSKDEHALMWISVPPFGRPYYKFEKARWGYLD